MEQLAFYVFAAIAVLAGLFILFSKNLVYGAFALFLAFLGVAALYILAGADFLGVAQIMIYVGGVLVLLIFGIMLTRKLVSHDPTAHNRVEVATGRTAWGAIIGSLLFFGLLKIIFQADFLMSGEEMISRSTIKTIGVELMTSHLLPFEVAGILLLVALVGAAYLAVHRNPVQP
ncbi:NADH-quinone oxidoreductase subunit J family protein [Dyadobacter sandarakinus]|uniref:NADH-quinone oxidoreductase subunit J n=1 Tax=Dyadobacter sandarakinus TaxID=2747268 RepID=A0ABX7IAE5_9BACT|nr:NADH-quinone oxidoreductase subunit J [Dyadobacter sandarakinus]QRR02770.1 NADH-quinone oxidoreductase subunit J [Dyadobacter sandarakinus]